MRLLARGCAALIAVVAILIGLLVSGFAARQGFFLWVAKMHEPFTGLGPLFVDKWDFDFDQLARLDLAGQTALVTGANSGLGYATSLHLARQGAHVLLACRSASKCAGAADNIRSNFSSASVEAVSLDTSSQASVRALATSLAGLDGLDMLVMNAGIVSAGALAVVPTADLGPEAVFATNHVGHFLLYNLLLPKIEAAAAARGSARVVVVSSASHYDSYDYGVATTVEALAASKPDKLYEQSKLANVLFAQEAARRLGPESKVYVNSAHPGLVMTNIFGQLRVVVGDGVFGDAFFAFLDRALGWGAAWNMEEGALTQIYLAAAADDIAAKGVRGKYFHPQAREVTPCRRHAPNRTLQEALWTFSEAIVSGG